MPAGRPSDYRPEYVEQAAKLCDLGATDDEIADFFNVSRTTIYRWKLEKPEFCNAIKVSKENADTRVERSLYQKATGYNFVEQQAFKIKVDAHSEEVEIVEVERHQPSETTAAIFWLKNRKKEVWRDKHDIGLENPDGTPLELGDYRKAAQAMLMVIHELKQAEEPEIRTIEHGEP